MLSLQKNIKIFLWILYHIFNAVTYCNVQQYIYYARIGACTNNHLQVTNVHTMYYVIHTLYTFSVCVTSRRKRFETIA